MASENPTITIFKGTGDGSYCWHLKARNGRIIAAGSGLNSRSGALDSVRTVCKTFEHDVLILDSNGEFVAWCKGIPDNASVNSLPINRIPVEPLKETLIFTSMEAKIMEVLVEANFPDIRLERSVVVENTLATCCNIHPTDALYLDSRQALIDRGAIDYAVTAYTTEYFATRAGKTWYMNWLEQEASLKK